MNERRISETIWSATLVSGVLGVRVGVEGGVEDGGHWATTPGLIFELRFARF